MGGDAMTVVSIIMSGICSLAGILISNKLTTYRIEQLEKKMDKHNNLIERMTAVESSLKSAHKRIDEIKEDAK